MPNQPELPGPKGARLTRADILRYEHALRDLVASLIPFKSHSIYFPPPGQQPPEPQYHSREQRLLVPLVLDEEFFGLFLAKGARLAHSKTSLPLLAKAVRVCLANLALRKAARQDPVTGLATRSRLLAALEHEIGLVQQCILPGSANVMETPAEHSRGCFGLALFDMDRFAWINQHYGYLFGEQVLARAAAVLTRVAPGDALTARLGEDVFALFLPGASLARSQEAADAYRAAVAAEVFEYPVSGDHLKLTVSAGVAAFPQDLHGGQLAAPVGEQARVLVEKARQALLCAKDLGRDQTMSFGKLLREGGQVLEILPLGRMAVSLGRGVDAKEGQRFLVWSPRFERDADLRRGADSRLTGRYPSMVKAEIMLLEVQQDVSFAETLHLTDPTWNVEPGDRLLLAQEPEERFSTDSDSNAPPKRDMVSGLLGHRDFLRHVGQARESLSVFTLGLVRLPEPGKDRTQGSTEARVQEVTALCREIFGADFQGGRFSSGSLILFAPGQDPQSLTPRFEELIDQAKTRLGLELACGLAGYPFLNFGKAQVLENCRKALDHSLLIAQGRKLAAFDSISLTISADRLFTLGDVYGAIEEYKLALLADEGNLLARNSLGICLARLGRMPQAKAEFERVLARDKKNLMALYNHGYACQRLGEDAQARKDYQRCLRLNPTDVYCLLRLGRMAEEAGKLAQARKYYERAASLPAGTAPTRRHLARLALLRGRPEEAREHLHQALVHDPKDAFALHMLAKLYLDGEEDPGIAELLARQSAALRPEQKPFWLELARALEAQGKTEEAKQARSKGL
ncbi:tetratricopeptide repeat protein [Fundidesulfovibrio butyratiphilus]